MKIGPVLHQQIVQLRWQFLTCLGLVLVLPLEEAFVNLRAGDGFYTAHMTLLSVFISPLLAGLMACATVQADLDDKRYLFWRSKPVGVTFFMMVKFMVGLVITLLLPAFPILFAVISYQICQPYGGNLLSIVPVLLNFLFITFMAYSLCFLCNVLIRKTARAWLVGMATMCLMILTPFILPLNFKDVTSDFLAVISTVYVSVTLGTALVAMILAFVAAARNWHMRTNLKGLLWTGATLVFLLAMLFSHQVANIKVLDEIKAESPYNYSLNNVNGKIAFGNQYVDIEDGQIHLNAEVPPSEKTLEEFRLQVQSKPALYEVDKELKLRRFPNSPKLYYETAEGLYTFSLYAYYKEEKIEKELNSGRFHNVQSYEKVYLRSFKVREGVHFPLFALDLSDCLNKESCQSFCMRLIGDKIVAFVGSQCVTLSIAGDGKLKLISRKPLMKYSHYFGNQKKVFKIPLAPTETINIQECIRFSIDFNFLNHRHPEMFTSDSLVDIRDGKITFCQISKNGIARYDVVKWDDEYIYCMYRNARPFMFIEQKFGHGIYEWSPYFVKDGNLYTYSDTKLMAFDIRSDRIRKIGHFVRISDGFDIEEVKVLANGQILMNARLRKGNSKDSDGFLYLMENPK